jgi:RNA polymerase-binding transcription factor DksA
MTALDTIDHDDWLATVRARLERTCDEHTARLLELTARTPDAGDASTHAALLATTRQGLADATEALRAIDDGRYGTCAACGDRIPAERLARVPQARTCVACRS